MMIHLIPILVWFAWLAPIPIESMPVPSPEIEQTASPHFNFHDILFDELDTEDRSQPLPDPSTVILVLAGVGMIGCSRRFGRRAFSL